MNETYLVMAKTVEEAVAIANREYAKNGKEISYEILEMPKKGFLGIGARDAKIKVTVSESESSKIGAELSSLVADLRGMKVHTNRGGSERQSDRDSQSRNQNQNQNQNRGNREQNRTAQAKNRQNAKSDKPEKTEKSDKPEKNDKPDSRQNANPARKQNNGAVKSAETKAEAKVEQKPRVKTEAKNARPDERTEKVEKTERPQKPQKSQKPEAKSETKPEAKTEQKIVEHKKPTVEEKTEAKPTVEKAVEAKVEAKPATEEKVIAKTETKPAVEPKAEIKPAVEEKAEAKPAVEKAPTTTAPAPAATAVAEETKTEYRSSLRNQAKPQRRQKQYKSQNAEVVPGAEAIISSPMGLTDFTRDEGTAGEFGEGGTAGGRMSNDIRKKSRKPAKNRVPEEKAAEAVEEKVNEVVKTVMPAEVAAETESVETAVVDAVEATETVETETAVIEETAVFEEDRQKVGVTEEEMRYALDFTNTLLRNMGINATAKAAECPEGEEYVIEGEANVYPKIDIDGEGTGILIGHHGETLDAVQYLVNLAALRRSKQSGGDYVKIVVDIENYRAKREETLRALARRMATRAVKYKRNVFLEPMNAYERRIIHSELHGFENVSTHSVGTDKNRKIIITYEGADKVQLPPRREREDGERREGRENRGSASHRGDKENRRPKKIQKMPIEKLPEFLATGSTEEDSFVEIED